MRRERLVGYALVVLAVVLAVIFYQMQAYASGVVDRFVALGGDCTTASGCLHQQATNWFVIGLAPSILIAGIGVYVAHFLQVSAYKTKRDEEDVFEIMLRSLSEDERKVLRIIKEEEGITQATMKYRADMSKSKLSQLLQDLEKRGLVKREDSKNTKKLYLSRPEK